MNLLASLRMPLLLHVLKLSTAGASGISRLKLQGVGMPAHVVNAYRNHKRTWLSSQLLSYRHHSMTCISHLLPTMGIGAVVLVEISPYLILMGFLWWKWKSRVGGLRAIMQPLKKTQKGYRPVWWSRIFTVPKINGKLTVSENVADGGIAAALEAAKRGDFQLKSSSAFARIGVWRSPRVDETRLASTYARQLNFMLTSSAKLWWLLYSLWCPKKAECGVHQKTVWFVVIKKPRMIVLVLCLEKWIKVFVSDGRSRTMSDRHRDWKIESWVWILWRSCSILPVGSPVRPMVSRRRASPVKTSVRLGKRVKRHQ